MNKNIFYTMVFTCLLSINGVVAMQNGAKRIKLQSANESAQSSNNAICPEDTTALESQLKKIKVQKGNEPDPIDVLYKAFKENDQEKIVSLFNAGASINMQNHLGDTLLHMAARKKNALLMHRLIECGINFAITNNEGLDPFLLWHDGKQLWHLWADLECDYSIGNFIRYDKLANYILHGGHLEQQDRNENSLVHYMTFNNQIPGIRMLLQYGAQASALGVEGTMPLHQAAIMGHQDAIKTLIFCPQGSSRSECELFQNTKKETLATLCCFKKLWDWENADQDGKDTLPYLPNEMRYKICSFILPDNLIDDVPLRRLARYRYAFNLDKDILLKALVDRHVTQVANILSIVDESGKTPLGRAQDEGHNPEIIGLLQHDRASLQAMFGKQIEREYKTFLRLK